MKPVMQGSGHKSRREAAMKRKGLLRALIAAMNRTVQTGEPFGSPEPPRLQRPRTRADETQAQGHRTSRATSQYAKASAAPPSQRERHRAEQCLEIRLALNPREDLTRRKRSAELRPRRHFAKRISGLVANPAWQHRIAAWQ
jgi:hypothetical protein